jgi:RNA polymerase sigma-70 factor (ECF subfamily)
MQLYQLLNECKQQNPTAQRRLYDQFAMSMFLLCRRYVKSNETAEEVMLNGFLKFFKALNNFTYVNDEATIGWLRKIMINQCLMELRSNNSFLQLADEVPEFTVDEEAISKISAEEIFSLITQLPLGYRTVFNLSVIEELSHKEIAQLLGISEGTSRSQLSKAKQLLQQMLTKNNLEYAWRKTK